MIDRVDASSNVQSTTLWEYVLVTTIASNTLTVTRGQGGSTAQSHNNNAVVEAVVTAAAWEDQRTALQTEHDTGGLHVISLATITRINLTSVIIGRMDVSTASISGFRTPTAVFFMPGTASSATIGAGGPLIMPRGGQWDAFTMTVLTVVSAASLTVQVLRNNASIFSMLTRPNILGGGTFASTASILTRNYNAGDVFTVNIDTGGSYGNLVVEGISS